MNKVLKYLLITLLLLPAFRVSGQYSIDKVCVGSERYYRVTGEPNSTYSWIITDPSGNEFPQPSDRDTIGIIWNVDPGVYHLSVVQHGEEECDAVIELGTVEVFAQPTAFAGDPIILCTSDSVQLTEAIATNYGSLTWTTSGDGTFSNDTILNPIYFPGITDLQNGSVVLTLTAAGMGYGLTCTPAVSGIMIIYGDMAIAATSTPTSCNGIPDGTVTLITTGGNPPFTFTLNSVSNRTGLFTGLAAGIYQYTVTDSNQCILSGEVTVESAQMMNAGVRHVNVNCYGTMTGSIIVEGASGGSGIYEFSTDSLQWQSSGLFENLIAGTYPVYMRDAFSITCVVHLADVLISEPPPVVPVFSPVGPLCLNTVPPALPSGSLNGISGTWQPDTINTSLPGVKDYLFTPDPNECAIETILQIEVSDQVIPLFAQIGQICYGSTPPQLPDTSLNGISGTWSPDTINTQIIGIIEYTFTPDTTGCVVPVTMSIEITDQITPLFELIGPLCQNDIPPSLPDTSLNGITGTWVPAIINTSMPGTFIHVFTPDTGQCAVVVSMSVQVRMPSSPVFIPMGPLCHNSVPPVLPNTSANGITGYWQPQSVNTSSIGTTTYLFTPDPGQCALPGSLSIKVTERIIPIFDTIGPFCQYSPAPTLPDTSMNGIIGSWFPEDISTADTGVSSYMFIPDGAQCADTAFLSVRIMAEQIPIFDVDETLCQYSPAPLLPQTSVNHITGTWEPEFIDTQTEGASTYTFTPDNGQCSQTLSVVIEVVSQIVPMFDSIGPLCIGSQPPTLSLESTNGITGHWIPSVINTGMAGTTIYTFLPDTGQCATGITMGIEITDAIVPYFNLPGVICRDAQAPILPDTSENGITGNWEPPAISTRDAGSYQYTFTPDPGQCADPTVISVLISGPSIDTILTSTATNGLENGQALIIAEGTYTPLAYSMDSTIWQYTGLFDQLQAGSYLGWVMDANGCKANQPFRIMNTVTGDVGVLAGAVQNCISIPFEIPVMAYDFTNISAFTIQLSFDSSVVRFLGFSQINQALLAGNLTSTLESPGILQIRFTANDSITLFSEDVLMMLNFIGLSSGITELNWNWLECVIYSAKGYELPAIYTKGSVEIRPAPAIFTEGSGNYCEGTHLTLNAGSLTGQELYYRWQDPDGEIYAGQTLELGALSVDDSGPYQVTASDSTACFTTETVKLNVNPNPTVIISASDTLCAEEPIMLTPGLGFHEYLWQDGTTDPQLVASTRGTYWVIATDINGCMGGDTVVLHPCELLIVMPTAFTPNGDELNDIFQPKYMLDVEFSFYMIIFNKWGQEIFRTNDITKGWDGTYKGNPCPPDLYTWTIGFQAPPKYRFLQKSPQSGNVMLLR